MCVTTPPSRVQVGLKTIILIAFPAQVSCASRSVADARRSVNVCSIIDAGRLIISTRISVAFASPSTTLSFRAAAATWSMAGGESASRMARTALSSISTRTAMIGSGGARPGSGAGAGRGRAGAGRPGDRAAVGRAAVATAPDRVAQEPGELVRPELARRRRARSRPGHAGSLSSRSCREGRSGRRRSTATSFPHLRSDDFGGTTTARLALYSSPSAASTGANFSRAMSYAGIEISSTSPSRASADFAYLGRLRARHLRSAFIVSFAGRSCERVDEGGETASS